MVLTKAEASNPISNSSDSVFEENSTKLHHTEGLPECLAKSAAHLAKAVSGLNKAGLTEKSLETALYNVSQKLNDFHKQAQLKKKPEMAQDLCGSNFDVGYIGNMKDNTDENANRVTQWQALPSKASEQVSSKLDTNFGDKSETKSGHNPKRPLTFQYPSMCQNSNSDVSFSKSEIYNESSGDEKYYITSQSPDEFVSESKDPIVGLVDRIKWTTSQMTKENSSDSDLEGVSQEDDPILMNELVDPGIKPRMVSPFEARCRFDMFSRARVPYRPNIPELSTRCPPMFSGRMIPPLPYPPDPKAGENRMVPPFVPYCNPVPYRPPPTVPEYLNPYPMPGFSPTMRAPVWRPSTPMESIIPWRNSEPANTENAINQSSASKSTPYEIKDKKMERLRLVSYESSEDSSDIDIEPFSFDSLDNNRKMTVPKPNSHHVDSDRCQNPTPKKLKTNVSDIPLPREQLQSPSKWKTSCESSVRGVLRFGRTMGKKLKNLNHSSYIELGQKGAVNEDYKKTSETMESGTRKMTLAEIVAGRSLKPETVVGPIPNESCRSSLGPLPPFPSSPFWGMYMPGETSALTGKAPEPSLSEVSSHMVQKDFIPKGRGRFSRYSSSPRLAQDSDSDSQAERSKWQTNFKIFHSFGVKYIDTHCHLDFLFSREGFRGNLEKYREKHPETFPDEFEGCVAVFCNPASFKPSGK